MCKCDPSKRTPFCGAPGCEWPQQKAQEDTPSIPVTFWIDLTFDVPEHSAILPSAITLQITEALNAAFPEAHIDVNIPLAQPVFQLGEVRMEPGHTWLKDPS